MHCPSQIGSGNTDLSICLTAVDCMYPAPAPVLIPLNAIVIHRCTAPSCDFATSSLIIVPLTESTPAKLVQVPGLNDCRTTTARCLLCRRPSLQTHAPFSPGNGTGRGGEGRAGQGRV